MRATRLQYFIELLVVCLLCSLSPGSFGQTVISPIPVVSLRATDPLGSWSGNPAVFTVYRSGNPQPSLNIYYRISGTASNGWDYQTIGNFVQIPSGVMAGNIVIQPINRGQTADATVELTLAPSPLMSPLAGAYVNYLIGSPSNATAVITSKALTNVPPLVDLVFPTNGAVFFTPLNLPLVACAADPDGFVTQVEFFANGKSLGVVTNSPLLLPPTPGPMAPLPPLPPYRPFVLNWTNVPPGTNLMLTATATDNTGATTTSMPVSITVHPGPPPPPPPPGLVVRITSPANGAMFRAPVNLPIYAYAAELTASTLGSGAWVTGVEFFAGTNDLGPGQRVVPPLVAGSPVPSPVSNLWSFVWSNVPPGIFPLTAVATDSRGAIARSEVVNVSILPLPPPPPPVLTDVVSIVAVDPIAIEGTNCWPWLGLASATPTWPNWTASTAVCRQWHS